MIYVYCVYYYHNDSDFFSVYCVLTLCIVFCVPFVFMYGLFILMVVVGIEFDPSSGVCFIPVTVCDCHTEIKGYLPLT